MKRMSFLIAVLLIFSASNIVFAEMFDNLNGLSAEQKVKLTNIYQQYKIENNKLEDRIMEYNNKINYLKNDNDKTQEQISLLVGAYERNVETLKSQQRILQKNTDELYRQNMTPEQFEQYMLQKDNVQDAFTNFLKK